MHNATRGILVAAAAGALLLSACSKGSTTAETTGTWASPTSRPPPPPPPPRPTLPPRRWRRWWSIVPACSTCTSPTARSTILPGPEQHRPQRRQGAQARRSTARSSASAPTSRHADGTVARRRRASTCTTACGSTPRPQGLHRPRPARALLRRRRGEDDHHDAPTGYGYPYKATDQLAHQLHDPQPHCRPPTRCGSPTTSTSSRRPHPAAARTSSRRARSGWTCRTARPTRCSTCSRARAPNGAVHLPRRRHRSLQGRARRTPWTVDRDGVLVGSGGHLHPGGLHDDLYLTARRRRRGPGLGGGRIGGRATPRTSSRPKPKYYEPAGAVSWDVAMTVTPRRLAGAASRRATCCRSRPPTTCATRRGTSRWGSWSCGWPTATDGKDPFVDKVDVAGPAHPRPPARERQPRRHRRSSSAPTRPRCRRAAVERHGRHPRLRLRAGRHEQLPDACPTVKAGPVAHLQQHRRQPLGNGIWHTITACKAPCNRSTGHRLPAGQRRHPVRLRRARHRRPAHRRPGHVDDARPTCPPGTYTYFCRIHPFMRGSFRVTP